jgi:hypothetical protein
LTFGGANSICRVSLLNFEMETAGRCELPADCCGDAAAAYRAERGTPLGRCLLCVSET